MDKMHFKSLPTIIELLILFILATSFTIAIQPTQQYNKILLEPFYISSMTQNIQYNYTVNINTPDGISQVKTAILTLDAWINPTRTFNAWMNNVQCNTKNYTISTTYASAGRGVVTFDCTNAIIPNQVNTVRYVVTGGNIGSSTSWLDLTYMNNPVGDVTIHGTEYTFGQLSKVWLQLLDTNGTYINNAICYTDIYYPDNTEFIERATMVTQNHDGIYYYDVELPLIEGVFPVIAECFYTAGQTYNYASNITMINGSLDGGSVSDTLVADGGYLLTTETSAGAGNPRRYEAVIKFNNGYVCTNIPSSLLTGISIGWTGRWNSNIANDVITLSIYNYTSSSWIDLPNTITGAGTGSKTVTNSLLFNNITPTGFVNGTGNVLLRFKDTNLSDGTSTGFDYDEVYVSCDQLSNPSWKEVRGSGEFHLNNPLGYRFVPNTLCNGDAPDSPSCAYFTPDDDGTRPEGSIIENITLDNILGIEIDQPYYYTTAYGMDCTAVDSVEYIKGNSSIDVTNTTVYSVGGKENCILTIPVTFNLGETFATIHIHMDNYLKWEVIRANDIRSNAVVLTDACNLLASQYNFTYNVPINITLQNLTNNTNLIYCNRIMDDLYWFDYYYTASQDFSTVGDYESYYVEIVKYYLPIIENDYLVISAVQSTINELSLLQYANNTLELLNITPTLTWNYTNRTLTYYPDMTNYSRIESAINVSALDVKQNFSSRFDSLEASLVSYFGAIAGNVWSYVNRVLTAFGFDNTDYTRIQTETWNATNRNLTYYPTQTDLTNYTLITDNVWNYTSRYTHGVILS